MIGSDNYLEYFQNPENFPGKPVQKKIKKILPSALWQKNGQSRNRLKIFWIPKNTKYNRLVPSPPLCGSMWHRLYFCVLV